MAGVDPAAEGWNSDRQSDGDDDTTTGDGDTTSASRRSLEELRRENDALRERVVELETVVDKLERTVTELETTVEDVAPTGDEPSYSDEDATAQVDAIDAGDIEGGADATPELVTSGGQPTKVIGTLTDDDGIGVWGESGGTGGTGVLGEATGTGVTSGVEGVTQSADTDAAAIRATAPNGGKGLFSSAASNFAIHAQSTESFAIQAESTEAIAINAETDAMSWPAIMGLHSAAESQGYGVRGDTYSSDSTGHGVFGRAAAADGATAKGVTGLTLGDGDGATGVHGKASADTGITYGVFGEVSSSSGYGVYTPDDLRAEGTIVTDSDLIGGGDALFDGEVLVGSAGGLSNIYFENPTLASPRIYYNPDVGGEVYLGIHSAIDAFRVDNRLEFDDQTPQRTAGPVAKGWIGAEATIENSVNVESVVWDDASASYRITLIEDNYWFDEYATYVTTAGSGEDVSWSVSSSDGAIMITPSDGSLHPFQFVTHKLIAGEASTASTKTSNADHELSEDGIERTSGEQATADPSIGE